MKAFTLRSLTLSLCLTSTGFAAADGKPSTAEILEFAKSHKATKAVMGAMVNPKEYRGCTWEVEKYEQNQYYRTEFSVKASCAAKGVEAVYYVTVDGYLGEYQQNEQTKYFPMASGVRFEHEAGNY